MRVLGERGVNAPSRILYSVFSRMDIISKGAYSKAGRHLASSLPTAWRHRHHPSTAASRTCIAKMSEPASKRQRAAAEAPKPKKTASNCTVVGE